MVWITIGITAVCLLQTLIIISLREENRRHIVILSAVMKASKHLQDELTKDLNLLHAQASRKDKYNNG